MGQTPWSAAGPLAGLHGYKLVVEEAADGLSFVVKRGEDGV